MLVAENGRESEDKPASRARREPIDEICSVAMGALVVQFLAVGEHRCARDLAATLAAVY